MSSIRIYGTPSLVGCEMVQRETLSRSVRANRVVTGKLTNEGTIA